MPNGDKIDGIYGITNPTFVGTCVAVSLSTTTAKSSQLPVGPYLLSSDVDVHIDQGATGVAATTSEFLLPAGTVLPFFVGDTTNNGYVAGILASGTGTLFIQPR